MMIEEIKSALGKYNGEFKEKNGVWEFTAVIARRKTFLSQRKLTYHAWFRVDDQGKVIKFTEMLAEIGSGLGAMGGFGEPREGSIEEQSNLFGKKYQYKFDYKEVRALLENTAKNNGYELKYQLTTLGL